MNNFLIKIYFFIINIRLYKYFFGDNFKINLFIKFNGFVFIYKEIKTR